MTSDYKDSIQHLHWRYGGRRNTGAQPQQEISLAPTIHNKLAKKLIIGFCIFKQQQFSADGSRNSATSPMRIR